MQHYCRLLFIVLITLEALGGSFKPDLDRAKNIIKADRLFYDADQKFLHALGNVKIINGSYYIATDRAFVDLEKKTILINAPLYAEDGHSKLMADFLYRSEITKNTTIKNAQIKLNDSDMILAKEVDFTNSDLVKIKKGCFSSCKACIRENPLWQISAEETQIDFKNQKVKYKNAKFSVAGYNIFFTPYFSHWLSKAPAQSGILKPEIYNGSLRVPLYLILKPNIDLTYTPRIGDRHMIHELEFRHLLENGNYTIEASKMSGKGIIKNPQNKDTRYHSKILGQYDTELARYNYLIENTSDKSYLRDYHGDGRSYIKSYYLSVNKIYDSGYFYIDSMKYRGLRFFDSYNTDPHIIPRISLKEHLDFANGWQLRTKNQFIGYHEKDKDIVRNSLDLDFNRDFYGPFVGQYSNFSVHNYLDIYKIGRTYQLGETVKDKTLVRHQPEFQIGTRVPLYNNINTVSFITEPQVNITIAPGKQNHHINSFDLIDSPITDINENNIFNKSRYSGLDYRENGTRISYGVSHYFLTSDWSISSFIGQMINSKAEVSSKSNYVGKLSLSYGQHLDLYYRFQRQTSNFRPLREEIVSNVVVNKFTIQNNLIFLRELKAQLGKGGRLEKLHNKTIKQLYSKVTFALNTHCSIFVDTNVDFSSKNKAKPLSKGLGINYNYDCIGFNFRLQRHYTHDAVRGGRKTNSSYSASVGLKSINM